MKKQYNIEHQDYLYKTRKIWDKLYKNIAPVIFERDGKVCRECGSTKNLTIDHIVAITNYGTNDQANLQVLCLSCNCKKGMRK